MTSSWLVGLCRSGSGAPPLSRFPGRLCPCWSRDWVLRTQASPLFKEPLEPRNARPLTRGRVEMPILMQKWNQIFCISPKFSRLPQCRCSTIRATRTIYPTCFMKEAHFSENIPGPPCSQPLRLPATYLGSPSIVLPPSCWPLSPLLLLCVSG